MKLLGIHLLAETSFIEQLIEVEEEWDQDDTIGTWKKILSTIAYLLKMV